MEEDFVHHLLGGLGETTRLAVPRFFLLVLEDRSDICSSLLFRKLYSEQDQDRAGYF